MSSQPPQTGPPKVTLRSQLKNFAIGGASGMIATCFVSALIPYLYRYNLLIWLK